jgi:hypothetical protein
MASVLECECYIVKQVTDVAVSAVTRCGFEADELTCRRGVCRETEYWIG